MHRLPGVVDPSILLGDDVVHHGLIIFIAQSSVIIIHSAPWFSPTLGNEYYQPMVDY